MRYAGKKMITMLLTLFAVTLFVFLAFHLISGDPATSMLGTDATPERIAALRQELGLNDPVLVQYGRWAKGFLTGDMGTSYSYRLPVGEMVLDKLPVTVTLTIMAFILIVIISVPMGIYTARHAGGCYIINGVAISYAFSYFFSPVNGAFDSILEAIKLGMLSGHGWLSDEKIVNFTLAFVSLWRFSGYHIILFMAALQSVNQDIMEAARIDGANSWQLFRYIQTPSIALMVDFVLFDNIRGAMQVFDIPFVMTQGGPGYASSTFTLYTIKTAFTFSNFGLASTMAVAIMLLIILIYIVQNFVIHKFILKEGR